MRLARAQQAIKVLVGPGQEPDRFRELFQATKRYASGDTQERDIIVYSCRIP